MQPPCYRRVRGGEQPAGASLQQRDLGRIFTSHFDPVCIVDQRGSGTIRVRIMAGSWFWARQAQVGSESLHLTLLLRFWGLGVTLGEPHCGS